MSGEPCRHCGSTEHVRHPCRYCGSTKHLAWHHPCDRCGWVNDWTDSGDRGAAQWRHDTECKEEDS